MRLTLIAKVFLLLAVPLVFQLAVLGLLAWSHRAQTTAREQAAHSRMSVVQAEHIRRLMLDAETGIRGFVITADPELIEPYEQAVHELPESIQRLVDQAEGDEEQSARARKVQAAAGQSLGWLSSTGALVKAGWRDAAIERMRRKEGKRLMDLLRAEVAAFQDAEEQRVASEARRAEDAERSTRWVWAIGTVATIALSAGLLLTFWRDLGRRFAVITANTQRLASSENLLAPVRGADELARLDQAFHQMAAKLTVSTEDLRRTSQEVLDLNQTLEERVDDRTTELAVANANLLREVGERERMELALRENVARLQAILTSTVNGVITIDERGLIESFNPAAEQLFGFSANEVIGRNVTMLMPPPFADEHDGYLAAYRSTGVRRLIGIGREVVGRRKNGSTFPIELIVSEVALGERKIYSSIVLDITRRKAAEESLQTRTLELAEANRDLTHRTAETEMFVYSVSHDLRSPLVNLQGFSKELGKACDGLATLLSDERLPGDIRQPARTLLAGKMTKSLGFIQASVLRLSNIIDALLRLSRAGRVEYRLQHVDLARTVARIVASLQGTIAEKRVDVRIGELPAVLGDATALEQVFANLIGNALNYLDPSRPAVIEVGTLPGESEGVTYFVRDTGLGIPTAHYQKIFQVFQRVHTGVGQGEGIGLAIVARVVDRHRGKVWVESVVGEGSTFFVRLPRGI